MTESSFLPATWTPWVSQNLQAAATPTIDRVGTRQGIVSLDSNLNLNSLSLSTRYPTAPLLRLNYRSTVGHLLLALPTSPSVTHIRLRLPFGTVFFFRHRQASAQDENLTLCNHLPFQVNDALEPAILYSEQFHVEVGNVYSCLRCVGARFPPRSTVKKIGSLFPDYTSKSMPPHNNIEGSFAARATVETPRGIYLNP